MSGAAGRGSATDAGPGPAAEPGSRDSTPLVEEAGWLRGVLVVVGLQGEHGETRLGQQASDVTVQDATGDALVQRAASTLPAHDALVRRQAMLDEVQHPSRT